MNLSLPGLGTADSSSNNDQVFGNSSTEASLSVTTTHILPARAEYRFEVPHDRLLRLRLLTGTAEMFGTELVISTGQQSTPYTFLAGVKAAVFTWHGCTIEVSGECGSEYIGEEGTSEASFGVHCALEGMREGVVVQSQAGRSQMEGMGMGMGMGPRVLVLGPNHVGKTTLCKALAGYAVRSGRAPVVVNLDSQGEGMLSLPGTISAGVFKGMLDVEMGNGWGVSPMSGPAGNVPVKLPLVYHFGLEGVGEGEGAVYKSLCSRLALAVAGRLQGDAEAREAGVLIDTPGVLSGGKMGGVAYEIIAHVVSEFSVNCIVCLGSERLYADIVKRFDGHPSSASNSSGETISVIKLARSGGCVERDETFMARLRAAQIKNYFYGAPSGSGGVALSPRQQQVDFGSLSVYRCVGSRSSGQDATDDDSFMPGGGDDDFYPGGSTESRVPLPAGQLLERVTSAQLAMQNALLAIMNCEPDADEKEIRESSVMGYVYVTEVDESRGRVGLLSPFAGRIPNRAIVWGNWPESVLGMV